MAMTTAMEWEAPIPVWIESISIDVDDDMSACDLMASIPTTPTTPVPSKLTHSIIATSTSTTEQQSLFGVLQDLKPIVTDDFDVAINVDSIFVVAESPVKPKTPARRSISPAKSKPTAKPARRARTAATRKLEADPIGRKEDRKDKQRGYEKGYRQRQKDKRADDEAEWMQLELQVRQLLAKRTAFVVCGPLDTQSTPLSTVSIRQRYLELLQEERALREDKALDGCLVSRDLAMSLWGSAASRRAVREQLNALAGLRECHTFEFSW
ncbi:uncharacterized protein IUM83_02766 [Phytophthora cinnamomi]|uniref:uncharacterized protein n=1 Tax=Phytophthora cinnamomi TaxID=4785 RepID=UPI003559CEA7|nr:hypothetical protein IUM83_02766 [Phytophthora cinnamomi]